MFSWWFINGWMNAIYILKSAVLVPQFVNDILVDLVDDNVSIFACALQISGFLNAKLLDSMLIFVVE